MFEHVGQQDAIEPAMTQVAPHTAEAAVQVRLEVCLHAIATLGLFQV
jgi:hypothetical protein